jgi:plastocyanin
MHRVLVRASHAPRSLIAVVLVAVLTIPLFGCSSDGGSAGSAPTGAESASMPMKAESGLQTCKLCGGKADMSPVEAAATLQDGVQTADIRIQGGAYSPNTISAKAGIPVRVTFTASMPATGCVAQPTFKALSKSCSAKDGPGTIELGSLQAGTYEFSCKMGSVGGRLVVQ